MSELVTTTKKQLYRREAKVLLEMVFAQIKDLLPEDGKRYVLPPGTVPTVAQTIHNIRPLFVEEWTKEQQRCIKRTALYLRNLDRFLDEGSKVAEASFPVETDTSKIGKVSLLHLFREFNKKDKFLDSIRIGYFLLGLRFYRNFFVSLNRSALTESEFEDKSVREERLMDFMTSAGCMMKAQDAITHAILMSKDKQKSSLQQQVVPGIRDLIPISDQFATFREQGTKKASENSSTFWGDYLEQVNKCRDKHLRQGLDSKKATKNALDEVVNIARTDGKWKGGAIEKPIFRTKLKNAWEYRYKVKKSKAGS